MRDLTDLGVATIGRRSTRGTDHLSFDDVGLPGFQFIQDRLEYNSRTHHSNMDVYDRVQRDDLLQMAVGRGDLRLPDGDARRAAAAQAAAAQKVDCTRTVPMGRMHR